MTLQTRLAALFSPTRRLIGDDAGAAQPGGALGGQQWVVPRALCQYRRQDLTALPVRQRAAAARLAVARHEPSPNAVTHVAWSGGVAHLWIWAAPIPEVERREQRWIPETLLAAPPLADGPRLLRLSAGLEGQYWQGGQLTSSQWWPQLPDVDAWQRFLRAAGLDPEVAPLPPPPLSFAWSPAPWGERQRAFVGSAATQERIAWVAVLSLIALGLGWQAAGLLRWTAASQGLAVQLEVARAAAGPLLTARERAEAVQSETGHLLRLQDGVSDYVLMGEVIALLPQGSQLGAWRRESAKLQVAVQGSERDPRVMVSAFAAHPLLANVTATPAAAGMQLEFALAPAVPADTGTGAAP